MPKKFIFIIKHLIKLYSKTNKILTYFSKPYATPELEVQTTYFNINIII